MTPTPISRREALQRAALFLGGTLAATTVAGVLDDPVLAWAATPAPGWAPQTLTAAQLELTATVAEHILPATDTPGARAVGVHRFVDALLTDYYRAPERDRFMAGLAGVDVRARRAHGKAFVKCTPKEQLAILDEMDRTAYAPPRAPVLAGETKAPSDTGLVRNTNPGPTGAQPPAPVEGDTEPVRTEMASGWFWRRMKEVTLVGYYTSQTGATQELRVNPMGVYKDIPYRKGDREWA